MSLVLPESNQQFQHILRLLNTNVDGKRKIMYALTEIKGVGRRYSNLVCKKADVDLNKRAGDLNSDELERIVTIIQNPTQFKIPTWFLNRQKDIIDGKDSQILSNGVDSKLRDDLERLKKIRAHRGLRHFWGLRVRGQHTKTTGRRGKTVGVSKKAWLRALSGLVYPHSRPLLGNISSSSSIAIRSLDTIMGHYLEKKCSDATRRASSTLSTFMPTPCALSSFPPALPPKISVTFEAHVLASRSLVLIESGK